MNYKRHLSFLVILTLILTIPITENTKVYAEENAAVVDMGSVSGDVIITSDGIDIFASTSGGLITTSSANKGITITGESNLCQVKVSGKGGSGDISVTLSDTAISLDYDANKSPFELADSADVKMTLKGENFLIASGINDCAGLRVSSPNAINIQGYGSLYANSNGGAGIGGHGNSGGIGGVGSNITIGDSVSISAISINGAGIGGGCGYSEKNIATGGTGENINISGNATVHAESENGAGIGGGYGYSYNDIATGGTGENINISGNATITAISENGAGIGGGCGNSYNSRATGGSGENINISGDATVHAESENGAGIGGGYGLSDSDNTTGGTGENINISGNATVHAESGGGAGVGGGYGESLSGSATGGTGQNISILGGFVTAKSDEADDIGKGKASLPRIEPGNVSDIIIKGGSVFADQIGTTPTDDIDGSAVYKVAVPAVKTGTQHSLLGNLNISVPLGSGSNTYTAKTVSDEAEHGSNFPAAAAAYIYLPAGSLSDISVGTHNYGYADVKAPPTSPYNNIVLWEFDVAFDGNGATELSQPSKAVTYGGFYGNLPVATKAGFSFDGWFTMVDGGMEITSGSIVSTTSAHTLYAKWTQDQPPAPKEFDVKFNVNGGNAVSPNTKNVTYGGSYGTLPTPTKKGNTFLGWYTALSGGTKITSGTKVEITRDQTLYARWQANKYTITFKANAKNVKKLSPRTKKVTFGNKLGTLPSPKRAGYKLKGWYTKPGDGTKMTKNTYMKYDRNLTLYARWSKNGKIVKCHSVKIKAGPGNKYKTKGYAKRNQKICITKKVKKGKYTWYKVKVGSKTGYIYKKYVKYI